MTEIIDINGLIEDGHIDLDEVFEGAAWTKDSEIATYTACVYGPEGDLPGEVRVILQVSELYGITAWRWRDDDGSYGGDTGDITLDRLVAIQAGEEHAVDRDEEPDLDRLVGEIVETGFFGDATTNDIRAICEEATGYSQGYLLLPAGEFVGRPIGRLWTTNGYLECPHVRLDATYPKASYAAAGLLAAIHASQDEEE